MRGIDEIDNISKVLIVLIVQKNNFKNNMGPKIWSLVKIPICFLTNLKVKFNIRSKKISDGNRPNLSELASMCTKATEGRETNPDLPFQKVHYMDVDF